MIWESVFLMSMIDILVIAGVIYLIWIFAQHQAGAARFGLQNAIGMLIGSCAIIGAFYAADLATMHLVPRFSTRELGHSLMVALHLNYSWIAFPLAMTAVAAAVMLMLTRLIPAAERWVTELETTREELRRALANTEAEVATRTRELEEARALLSAALEQSPSGILIARPAGSGLEFLAFNRAARSMVYGDRADEYANTPVGSLPLNWKLEQADGSTVDREQYPIVRATLASEPTTEFEGRIRREDGGFRWMLSNGVPVVDEAGNLIAGLSVFSDITRFKELEQLNQRRLEFETMLRRISDAFINPPTEGFDLSVQSALDDLREFVAADRSYLILLEPESNCWRFAHESTVEGVERQKTAPELAGIKDAQSPWFFEKARAGKTVIVNDLTEISVEANAAADREFYARWGAGAELGVPMVVAGEVIGIVGVEMEGRGRHWTEDEIRGFELAARVFADAIAKKQVDDALRENESRFRVLTENLPGVVYMCKNDDRYSAIYLNDQIESVLGYPKERFLSGELSFAELNHPDELQGIHAQVDTAIATQKSFSLTFRMKHRDGQWRWMEDHGVGFFEGERLKYIEGFMLDVTERRNTEAALARNEQLFRAVVDNLPIGLNLKDTDHRVVLLNRTFKEWLGASEAWTGKTISKELLQEPPEIEERRTAHERAVLTRGEVVNREEEMVFADGSRHFLEIKKFPVADSDGKITAVGSAAVDITERKRAEQELAKSERLFRTVLDNLPIGVNLKDQHDRFVVINPTYADWYGVSADRLLGHTPEEVFSDRGKLDSRRKTHEQEVLRTGAVITREEATERPDGKQQHLMIQKFPVVLSGDEPAAIGTAAIDITERHLADMEVRRLNENLEQRVLARTRQLEATNKELESFSYSVSHDLRAPLRHISGFVELLRSRAGDGLDRDSLHYLEAIGESAGRMGTLIDNLLHFSRIGRAEMNPTPVDIKALIDDVVREFGVQESERKIDWQIGSLPTVRGDRVLLKQIFVNLISNAVKFTRNKELAKIEIGTTENEQSKPVIYVRDNGVGFDEKYAGKLFAVFQRLHSEEEFEGTGIGLANVERIVQRHGGRVWGEANPDAGATFYVSLPMAEEAAA